MVALRFNEMLLDFGIGGRDDFGFIEPVLL